VSKKKIKRRLKHLEGQFALLQIDVLEINRQLTPHDPRDFTSICKGVLDQHDRALLVSLKAARS
jgi:hypothetical protein